LKMTGTNGKVKPILMHDYRCRACGRLLFRAILPAGAVIEIRCTKSSCHTMTILDMQPGQPVLQLEPVEAIIEAGA